jgi:AcrR family transcriptional regulator
MPNSIRRSPVAETVINKESRRDQILENATRIFCEKTYHGTSLQEIADSVGMRKGSLYYYITSKEKLLARIILDALQTLNDSLLPLENTDLNPIETLRQVVREHVKFNAKYREVGTLFLTEKHVISSLAETDQIMQIFERRDKLVAKTLRAAIEAGVYQPVDIRITSLAIVGLCNSVLFWYRPSGHLTYNEIADSFFGIIHHGLSMDNVTGRNAFR